MQKILQHYTKGKGNMIYLLPKSVVLVFMFVTNMTMLLASASDISDSLRESNIILQPKIIGGGFTELDTFNWFVRAGSGGGCGGSLVSPEFVLTAAHCPPENFNWNIIGPRCIREANMDRENCGQYREVIQAKDVFIHPLYERVRDGYDFMLIQLEERSNITAVEMDFGNISTGYEDGRSGLWTVGFGLTQIDPELESNRLMELEKKYVSLDRCLDLYRTENFISIKEGMICAQNEDPFKSACRGDSGGPLYDSEQDKLVGVVSAGPLACNQDPDHLLPVVYSRIASEMEWIRDTICANHSKDKPEFCYPTESPSNSPSPLPSKKPSASPQPTKSASPTITPRYPQQTYFQIVSYYEGSNGEKWCLSPEKAGFDAEITVSICSDINPLQLWKSDITGQLRTKGDDGLCLKHKQNQSRLKMRMCPVGKAGFTFLFDAFFDSLLWIKNKADFEKWGLRAISLKREPEIGITRSTRVVIQARRPTRNVLQKWIIVYPDLPIE